ncbi:MAG TPA: hypothetical protein VLD37_04410, partial [Candidatus Bilamarchaeum sp.]|nr:hypothetical protein [Candidatus Bilamarchaeum sp.]
MEFSVFIRAYFRAITAGDRDFLLKVYGGWFDSAGFPKEQKEQFFHAIFTDLKQLAAASLEREECFGAFCIAHLKDGSGEYSLIFRRKGDSWEYFNERTDFSLFKKVYAIGYVVEGGARPEILFNGEKSPILTELGSSGAVSLINAALKIGENELTI